MPLWFLLFVLGPPWLFLTAGGVSWIMIHYTDSLSLGIVAQALWWIFFTNWR